MGFRFYLGVVFGILISILIFRGVTEYQPFHVYSTHEANGIEIFNIIEDSGFSGYAYYDVTKAQAIFKLQ